MYIKSVSVQKTGSMCVKSPDILEAADTGKQRDLRWQVHTAM